VFTQIAVEPDIALTLGHLGDPLLREDWPEFIDAAREAGVFGVHVATDLLVEEAELDRLLAAPIDVISVHLNADTAETYGRLMGIDGFDRVIGNVKHLLNRRADVGRTRMPWIVPRMVKTIDNVAELDDFFNRWTYYCGHALVEPATTGCGAAPDRAVLDMSPPRRRPCRQIGRRMTVRSDGRLALCDQDWRAEGVNDAHNPGDVVERWAAVVEKRKLHEAGRFDELAPCARCRQWHRP